MFALFPSLILLLSTLSFSQPANARATIAKAYYPGWKTDFSPSNVPWSKYTDVVYSFMKITKDGGLTLEGYNPRGLDPFIKAAHEHGVNAWVAFGGWNASQYISTAVSTPEKRKALVQTVKEFAEKHDVDGLDWDWESPGKQTTGCNVVSKDETGNFLSYLEEALTGFTKV
ncbi:hypothetical protein MPER_08966, partial [Moniliophthora perniciosa FA553]